MSALFGNTLRNKQNPRLSLSAEALGNAPLAAGIHLLTPENGCIAYRTILSSNVWPSPLFQLERPRSLLPIRQRWGVRRSSLRCHFAQLILARLRLQLPLHDTPAPPIILLETPPSQLEQRIGTARRAATEALRKAHTKVQGLIDKWIGVEHAVESVFKLPFFALFPLPTHSFA